MSLLTGPFKSSKQGSGVDEKSLFKTDLAAIDLAHHKTTYRGIPMLKCAFDIINYQMIVSELRPDLIIEIGTHRGGSALYFADLLKNLGSGEIHSIDILDNVKDEQVLEMGNIRLFKKGWQNYDLAQCSSFEKIMVIDDGSHVSTEVRLAFEKFRAVVSVGSYYIIEDGIISQLNISKSKFKGGPLQASEEILKSTDAFVHDRKWSDFFGSNATFNPKGYLKRVK